MSGEVYANLEAIEASVSGDVTHTLKRKSRQIILSNDSGSTELKYKFNDSENYATLKPTEQTTLGVWVRQVYLRSSNPVNYRLWVYG